VNLSNTKINAAIALICAIVSASPAVSQSKHWVLPQAGGGVDPSPPSVHGYLTSAGDGLIVVKLDRRDGGAAGVAKVQLLRKTGLFTAFGGLVSSHELRPGQYVWVWYVTADPAKAGTPPHAAVVLVWSKDSDDKPDSKTRWSYDKQK
jgi:hypothetical protein